MASLSTHFGAFAARPLLWRAVVAGGVLASAALAGVSLWTLVLAGDSPAAIGSAGWFWTASLAAGALSVMAATGQRTGLLGLQAFFALAGLPMLLRGLREDESWLLGGAVACALWLVLSLFARPDRD
ncbi:MAG: hypothetical protein R3F34_11010 [Planctomycetota bacterium]